MSTAAVPAPGEEWRKLDRRTLLVTAAVMTGVATGAGVPTAVGLSGGMGAGRALAWVLPAALLLIVCGTGGDYVRWRRTRYRIGPDRAELHTGLFLVKRRSLGRERIRSVDLTANPLLRILGLVKVRIGTGSTPAANPPWNSTPSPARRASGSVRNCWTARPPARERTGTACWPFSTPAGSGTRPSPSSRPRWAGRPRAV